MGESWCLYKSILSISSEISAILTLFFSSQSPDSKHRLTNSQPFERKSSWGNILLRKAPSFRSPKMKAVILTLFVGLFLHGCEGCPAVLQSSPCFCACYDMLTSCQENCEGMSYSARSRCRRSCADRYQSCNRICLPLPF